MMRWWAWRSVASWIGLERMKRRGGSSMPLMQGSLIFGISHLRHPSIAGRTD